MDNPNDDISRNVSQSSGNQAPSPFFHSSSSDEDAESGETSSLEMPSTRQCSLSVVSNESSGQRHRKNVDSTGGGSKTCRVCGDKALGYNFNVISCESCKAFFRRNALKKKEFVCPFSNTCDVTYVSRRFCQKCRLKKCFDVGMNADWIMTEEALAAKRRRRITSGTPEKVRKTSPEPRKITPNIYPRINNMDQIVISNGTDGLAVLANCSSPAPSSQFALLTQQGGTGPKVITLVPVQQFQQSTLTQKPDSASNTLYCYGTANPASTNVLLAGNSQPCSSFAAPTKIPVSNSILNQLSSKTDGEETIPVPKNVLINLITKCHSGDTASLGQDTSTKMVSSNSGQHRNPPNQCCCKCTCGAKSNTDPIGLEKSDKMISTDDLPYHFGHSQHGSNGYPMNSPSILPPPVSTQSMTRVTSGSPLDFSSSGLTRGCRGLSQQQLSSMASQQDQQGNSRQQPSMYEEMLDAAIISVFHDGNSCVTTSNYGMQTCNSANVIYSHSQHRQLGQIEQKRLDELLASNEVMKEPLDGMNQRIYEGHNVDPKLMDVINMTDIAVRRIIKMNKRIEAFRNLCQEDQIALLKGGCTELMILRGIMTYDPENDSWLTRVHNTGHEYIKLEVLKGVRGNVYEQHKKYVQSFRSAWRTSEPIMLILGAITLFNPCRPNIVHKEMIKMERAFYYELLKNYLTTIYDTHEAESAYSGLVERLETLHQVNEFAASIFLDINPKDVEPLLIEIFDLKK